MKNNSSNIKCRKIVSTYEINRMLTDPASAGNICKSGYLLYSASDSNDSEPA